MHLVALHNNQIINGYLLLTTPNVMNLENKVKFFFNINIYQDIYRYCYNPRYSLHYREYTKKDLTKLLKEFLKFDKLCSSLVQYNIFKFFLTKILLNFIFLCTEESISRSPVTIKKLYLFTCKKK